MGFGLIALGVIGVTYVTGDSERKQKMKNIGSQIVEVTKEATVSAVKTTKTMIQKIKAKHDAETNNKGDN